MNIEWAYNMMIEKMQIDLKESGNGYKWKRFRNIYYIGVVLNEDIDEFFSSLCDKDYQTVVSMLRDKDGFYSCVIVQEEQTYIFVDHVRSFPIIIGKDSDNNQIVVTDSLEKIGGKLYLKNKEEEMKACQFINGSDTVFENVMSVPASHCAVISDQSISIHRYYKAPFKEEKIKNIDDALDRLKVAYENVFSHISDFYHDYNYLVPLSGGHDSRLVLKLLEIFSPYSKKIVYNYGELDEMDYTYAKKAYEVISNASDRFIHINYRDKKMAKQFRALLPEYSLFASKGVSCPCVSELCAVMDVKPKLNMKENHVVIPGYGGVVTGLYFKKEYFEKKTYTIEEVVDVVRSTFVNQRVGHNLDHIIVKYISSLTDKQLFSLNEMLYLLQQYTFEEEQAKFIQNATQNFNFFGLEWFTPYMTKMVLEAWGDIDPALMLDDYIFKELENKIYSKEERTIPFCGSKENTYGRKNYFGRFTKYILPRSLSKYDMFIPIIDHYKNLLLRRADGINAYVLYETIKELKKK